MTKTEPWTQEELEERRQYELRQSEASSSWNGLTLKIGIAVLLAGGSTPKVVQRQLRHSDARTTLEVAGVLGNTRGYVSEGRGVSWSTSDLCTEAGSGPAKSCTI
jgi:hypothetical protein